MAVEILIDENGAINAVVSTSSAKVEIIAAVTRSGSEMRLDGVHTELLVGGPLDRSTIEQLCAEFCRHYGVETVVVQGARRTTGRSAGRIPREFRFEV